MEIPSLASVQQKYETRQNPIGSQFPTFPVATVHTTSFNTATFRVLTARCIFVCVQNGPQNNSS